MRRKIADEQIGNSKLTTLYRAYEMTIIIQLCPEYDAAFVLLNCVLASFQHDLKRSICIICFQKVCFSAFDTVLFSILVFVLPSA